MSDDSEWLDITIPEPFDFIFAMLFWLSLVIAPFAGVIAYDEGTSVAMAVLLVIGLPVGTLLGCAWLAATGLIAITLFDMVSET